MRDMEFIRSLFIAHELERYSRWLSKQRADGDGGTLL